MSIIKAIILLSALSYYNNVKQVPEFDSLYSVPPIVESGLSSWYGSLENIGDSGMHGKITATGEEFISSKRTCASRSIPLNTIILIELKRNGKRAWCRVNDRGPYGAINDGIWVLKLARGSPGEWRGVLDMSRGTAEAIGFDFNRGLEEINIMYFKKV
jgi:rare lipoprotein A